MTPWLLWVAAPLIGLLLGLFGAGGGMLTVPLLIYAVGLPVKEAVATSLWIVGTVSLIAATQQHAWRVVRLDLMVFFGLGGVLGGMGGAWLGVWIAPWIQEAAFALLLLIVAWWMTHVRLTDTQPDTGPCRCGVVLLVGAVLGFLTGLLGVGGGFLIVPALLYLGVSHLPTAVTHSLVLIVFHTLAGGLVYLNTIPQSPRLIISIALLAGIGSLLGTRLLHRLPRQGLQRAFSVGLTVIGLAMAGRLVAERLVM